MHDKYKSASRMSPEAIDLLSRAREGIPLRQLADHYGVCHETIRKRMDRYGITTAWRAGRLRAKRVEKARVRTQQRLHTSLVTVLQQTALTKARDCGWPTFAAASFYLCRERSEHGYHQRLVLYERVSIALREQRQPSLATLGEGIIPYDSQVQRLLKEVFLHPFRAKRGRQRTKISVEKAEAIRRAYDHHSAPASLVAYFLSLPPSLVQQRFQRMNGPRSQQLSTFDARVLSPRLASEIYWAYDHGYTPDEITKLLNIHPNHITRAVSSRQFYEPEIRSLLQLLYPEHTVTQPYTTW